MARTLVSRSLRRCGRIASVVNEFANSTPEYPLTVTVCVAFPPVSNSPEPILCTLHHLSRFRHHQAVSRPTSLTGRNRWVSLAHSLLRKCVAFIDRAHQPIISPRAATPNTKPIPEKAANVPGECWGPLQPHVTAWHRNEACRSSVPENSPISGFCDSGPGLKHCLCQPIVCQRSD